MPQVGLGRKAADYRVNAVDYLRTQGTVATARKAASVTARISRAQARGWSGASAEAWRQMLAIPS